MIIISLPRELNSPIYLKELKQSVLSTSQTGASDANTQQANTQPHCKYTANI